MADLSIVSDSEVIRHILQAKGRFVMYFGAGASAEAGVKIAAEICEDIRTRLIRSYVGSSQTSDRIVEKVERRLHWSDKSMRYATCVRELGGAAQCVGFFRELLKGKKPSFSHHAIALLAQHRLISRTCLTTNFDKLIETAFAVQGALECQAVRTDDELQFLHADPEKAYVVKLHGDYDTNNTLNTEDETVRISQLFEDVVTQHLTRSGLIVLGTAGWEKSISTLFDELDRRVGSVTGLLEFGLYWGVFMRGSRAPAEQLVDPIAPQIQDSIKENLGGINPDIRKMMNRLRQKGIPAAFFPLWGTGSFLNNLIQTNGDHDLIGTSQLYLDHEMRLRSRFKQAGLSDDAVSRHLKALEEQRQRVEKRERGQDIDHEMVFEATNGSRGVRFVYGDITRRSEIDAVEHTGRRKAIVSPEETRLSAGGGVAYQLLTMCGKQFILNELAKQQPVEQGAVVVTSGGNFPVSFVFHAAAVKIEEDGYYDVSKEIVRQTVKKVLDLSLALEVEVIWIPLIGGGGTPLSLKDSFASILEALATHSGRLSDLVIIVARSGLHLSSTDAKRAMAEVLGTSWKLTPP